MATPIRIALKGLLRKAVQGKQIHYSFLSVSFAEPWIRCILNVVE